MGTFGTGPVGSDGALDLLDELTGQPADQRRETLGRIFSRVRGHPDLLWREFFPDEIVAAAAIVAASLPGGEDIRRDLVGQGYHMHTVQIPAPDHELTASALHALLFAAGPDGPWHDGWATPETAAQAQHTSDQLTAILSRQQSLPDENSRSTPSSGADPADLTRPRHSAVNSREHRSRFRSPVAARTREHSRSVPARKSHHLTATP